MSKKRPAASESSELAQLRRENKALKKENAELRGELPKKKAPAARSKKDRVCLGLFFSVGILVQHHVGGACDGDAGRSRVLRELPGGGL